MAEIDRLSGELRPSPGPSAGESRGKAIPARVAVGPCTHERGPLARRGHGRRHPRREACLDRHARQRRDRRRGRPALRRPPPPRQRPGAADRRRRPGPGRRAPQGAGRLTGAPARTATPRARRSRARGVAPCPAPCSGPPRAPGRGRRQYRNRDTWPRRSSDIRASSATAEPIWLRVWEDWVAAEATPVMLVAISPEPVAASATERDISVVVAVCSSTAEAIVSW